MRVGCVKAQADRHDVYVWKENEGGGEEWKLYVNVYGRVCHMLVGNRVGGERMERGYGLKGEELGDSKGKAGKKGAWVEPLD